MKHLQYFQKRKAASIDNSIDAPGSENKSRNDNAQKWINQTLAGLEPSSHGQNFADRIGNYCVHILIFVLTCHAIVSKFKNSYEKNVLTAEDGLKILRVIFLTGRNIVPAQQQNIQSLITAFVNQLFYGYPPERLLTQLNTIAPGLHGQINTVIVTSEAVVSALWKYTFSLWLLQ